MTKLKPIQRPKPVIKYMDSTRNYDYKKKLAQRVDRAQTKVRNNKRAAINNNNIIITIQKSFNFNPDDRNTIGSHSVIRERKKMENIYTSPKKARRIGIESGTQKIIGKRYNKNFLLEKGPLRFMIDRSKNVDESFEIPM